MPTSLPLPGLLVGLLLSLAVALACKADASGFPKEVRQNFMASCTGDGADKDQCGCIFKGIEETFTLEQFIGLDQSISNAAESPEVQAIIDRCLYNDESS